MLIPKIYTVKSIEHETPDIFTLSLAKKDDENIPSFQPGQFNMLYQFGIGESAISISGDPTKNEVLTHTIRAVGSVTKSLQKLKAGESIGVRGPFGSHWPLHKKDCDVLVIAGGIGFAPLRPALYMLEKQRQNYNKISLLYGTRTPSDILFKKDMEKWKTSGFDIEVTLDYADPTWQGQIGVVTYLIKKHLINPLNTLVLICGPEIMIKFAIIELMRSNVDRNNIFASLERNMQCAVGFCGHCQYGPYFLCKDGPVFCYEQLESWLTIKEL